VVEPKKEISMAQINVTITGASKDATITWDQELKSRTNNGGGNFAASFPSGPGSFVYAIVVFGDEGDPWTAKVTDGTTTHNHAGHMSPAGFDTTGDTLFQVQA
jgi:hypothetical protein